MKEKNTGEEYLTKTYTKTKLSAEWMQRLEKIENNPKSRCEEAKKKETFEKVVPVLRKLMEDE